uniref:Homeobox domain-containing protein n=1 Tax=Caenorhabditis japonica TaxID=281687 RepID=A0A8R1HZN6_CAEJA
MNQQPPLFDSNNCVKEPKIELEDDPTSFSSAFGTSIYPEKETSFDPDVDSIRELSEPKNLSHLQKQKRTLDKSTAQINYVPEKIIKEEEPDQFDAFFQDVLEDRTIGSNNFFEGIVKTEVEDEEEMDDELDFSDHLQLKDPKEEEEETEISPPKSAHLWKPKIKSLHDFTMNDSFDDDDHDMCLGSSILFEQKNHKPSIDLFGKMENPKLSNSPANFDDDDYAYFDDDPVVPKKQLPVYKIKRILSERFEENRHPNATEMVKIAESCGVRYRTVFDDFENRRIAKRVKCEKDDACERIRTFFVRDNEPLTYNKVKEDIRAKLEEEIELHLLSRKRFSLGYVHIIMEKTDLPASYIRGQYENWKKKMLTKDRDEYKNKEWKKEPEDRASLSMDVLRKLEDAYLTKKYQCEEKEWSPKEITSLATHLEIEEKTVTAWIEKRNEAVLGLNHDVVEMRKQKAAKLKAADGRKLPSCISVALNIEYSKDDRPTLARRIVIAKKLKLTEVQVRNYFNKKRGRDRRNEDWEKAREDVLSMPHEKVQLMEKVAIEKRKTALHYMSVAADIGVSYMTLMSFVNWRKSVTASRLNMFRYQVMQQQK